MTVDLQYLIIQELFELYKFDEAERWLITSQPLLEDHVPSDLISAGRGNEVLRAIRHIKESRHA